MKKFMIRADVEGVSGVVSYAQVEPPKTEYAYGQRMFMADLLAVVKGLHEGGAEDIVVYDQHYYGRNIDLEQIPDYVNVICGKPPYRSDWAGGLDSTFAGMVLLGLHSKSGTPGGLLSHTYELDIADLRLNGVSVGEIGMEAAIAGDYGVSVVLITGDSAAIQEAEELLPGVRGISVKEALSQEGALCYPLSVTTDLIAKAAAGVVQSPPEVKPYSVGNTATLEVELHDGSFLQAVRQLFKKNLKDERTLVLHGSTATEVWSEYWQKKLQAQALATH